MTDTVKRAGGAVSSALTGGAYSTNGGGWAQGGDFNSVLNNATGGIIDPNKNKIDVPGATARPEWNLSTADGKLRSDLLLGDSMPVSATQSQDVLNSLLGRANAVGPSESAKYLQEANTRNTQNQMDSADALGRTNIANTTGALAMRGGLDSGARERVTKTANNETMMNKQKIQNDSAGRNLEILANDEQGKLDIMKSLPSSLLGQAGFEQGNKQFDISNTLNTVGNKYGTDMSAWAANQSAIEQANLANKKSGVLGLGMMGL